MLVARLTVTPVGLQKDKNDCSKFALELAKHAFLTVAKLFTFVPDVGQRDPDAIRQFEFGGGWNDAGPHIRSLCQATLSAGISPGVKIEHTSALHMATLRGIDRAQPSSSRHGGRRP